MMKMKMVRNAGQSQRFRFVVLVIGCFLVSMTFIVISRPSALSVLVSSSSSVPDQTAEVVKTEVKEPARDPPTYEAPAKTEPEITRPLERNDEEEKPQMEDIPGDLPENQPEKKYEEQPPEVDHSDDEQRNRLTLPTVSNYTINDPDTQLDKTPAQEQPDSDTAPWNPNRKPLCDMTDSRSDLCDMTGDVRIPGNTSTVIFYESGDSKESYTVRPYPRKGDEWCLSQVREIIVKASSSAPKCTVKHDVPAVMFSLGGYTGNQFHDFTDILIPLFQTAAHFQGEVKLVITDYKPYFVYKYLQFFQKLSHYPVIEHGKENEVHCFKKVIVGLRSTRELSIDPKKAPNGYKMTDFTKFLRAAFSLPREAPTNIEDLRGKKPKLLLINRERSRIITNVEQLQKMAEDLGFEVVVSNAEFGSDTGKFAELVNSCDVLVGVHGAGLTNAVFLPPNGTMVQIVPWGKLEDIALYNFGDPAKDMGLNYMQYSIAVEESSLIERFPRDNPVIANPAEYHKKGFQVMRETYLDGQNVKIDVKKFRSVLWKALEHVIQ